MIDAGGPWIGKPFPRSARVSAVYPQIKMVLMGLVWAFFGLVAVEDRTQAAALVHLSVVRVHDHYELYCLLPGMGHDEVTTIT